MTGRRIGTFVAYVMLVASRWALQGWFPSMLPESEMEVLVLLSVVLGVAVSSRNWGSVGRSAGWHAVCSGLLLFGVSFSLQVLPLRGLPVLTRVSLLTLVPAVLVVISSVRGPGGAQFLKLLAASLAGVAGCLLFLPVDLEVLLAKPTATAVALVAVLSIAMGGYLGHEAVEGMAFRPAVVLLVGPSAVVVLLISVIARVPMAVPQWGDVVGVLWGGAELLLLVFLIRGMRPVVFGARFLLVPLITSIEGFVLVRPAVTWRLLAGTGLLSFGAIWLLRGDQGEALDSPLSLL